MRGATRNRAWPHIDAVHASSAARCRALLFATPMVTEAIVGAGWSESKEV
eukprot:CAMPEP_0176311222 /NCGR_PEP_ID=MMETSP0121_2-20121125/66025_1 /TAXON_ID=160619 /ORGANISM="Kryptoperidinium foliaceum, Strain CCMP 1326" /LENGTH=49 /DNA_ID= /DNA_START= /DNA_END= /DNA_ORIENTATION=